MLTCPRCSVALAQRREPVGITYVCPRCAGRATAVAVLRRAAHVRAVTDLWVAALMGDEGRGMRCPSCGTPSTPVRVPAAANVTGDVCRRCQFVWFEKTEFARLPPPDAADGDQGPARPGPAPSDSRSPRRPAPDGEGEDDD
jgi:Zn-finger nucleic acid-binding protein